MPHVIHPFIFVYLCSSGLLSFRFLHSSFSFPQSLSLSVYFLRVLAPLHPFHSLVLFSRSWCRLFFFIPTYFCSADVFLLRSRCSSILTIPSLWLIRRLISPHCHSFLIPFLSRTLNCPLSLLLATSLVFLSALLAPLSSPCLEFRLLIYTLVSRIHHFPLSLPLSRPAFSCFPLFSMCSLLRWNSSVYCIFFSFLYSFPTLSLRAPFDPRWAVFPLLFLPSSDHLFLSHGSKVYSLGALDRLKISQALNASNRERFE